MLGLISRCCLSHSVKACRSLVPRLETEKAFGKSRIPAVLCRRSQQYTMQAAMSTVGHKALSRPAMQQQSRLLPSRCLQLSPIRRLLVQYKADSNTKRLASWLPRAEAGAGGGSTGGAGGRKGYSSGDNSSSADGDGGLLGAYNRMLEQNPLLVKAVTTAILSALGNLICQLLVENKQELDLRRFTIFTGLGFVWVAPCLHVWYGTLNKLVTATGNTGAIMRMACDQLGFAPLFISSMIAILTVLDGKGDRVVEEVKSSLPSAIRANWMLWVPAQFLNFRFIPVNYQVLFSNLVSVAWNVYFSFATRPRAATA